MKTTEATVTPQMNDKMKLKSSETAEAIAASVMNITPVKSLRPMKSMVRTKSFTPQKVNVGQRVRRRTVKI